MTISDCLDRSRDAPASGARLDVQIRHGAADGRLEIRITNRSPGSVKLRVLDHYSGRTLAHALAPDRTLAGSLLLAHACGRYDVAITVDEAPDILYRFAGRVETGGSEKLHERDRDEDRHGDEDDHGEHEQRRNAQDEQQTPPMRPDRVGLHPRQQGVVA